MIVAKKYSVTAFLNDFLSGSRVLEPETAAYTLQPLVVREQVCIPSGMFKLLPAVGEWCQINCLRYPPNCPAEICQCP